MCNFVWDNEVLLIYGFCFISYEFSLQWPHVDSLFKYGCSKLFLVRTQNLTTMMEFNRTLTSLPNLAFLKYSTTVHTRSASLEMGFLLYSGLVYCQQANQV